jgi:diguanylate cyclase (GGDEF)-like protein/PAS domain S-box-containing protein
VAPPFGPIGRERQRRRPGDRRGGRRGQEHQLHLTYTAHLIPLFFTGALVCVLLAVAWRERRSPAAGPFAVMLAALLVWTIAFVFELASSELAAKVVWANIQYLAIAFLPVLWLDVVLAYLGRRRPRWSDLVLYAIPIATVVLSWSGLGLFRGAPQIISDSGGLRVLDPDYGPWVPFVYTLFAYTLSIAAIILLVDALRRGRGLLRWQSALLLTSSILPLAANALYLLGITPLPYYNPTVAVFALSAVLVAVALFRFRLFEVAPLARETVVEHLRDPVIVLDRHDRLADYNAAAARLLPALTPHVVGSDIGSVLAASPDVLERVRERAEMDAEVTLPSGGEQRHYSLELSPVRDGRGRLAGHTAVFHDITERVLLFERVKELASLDGLTGIFNRRHFFELSEAELDRARRHDSPVSLILFDLDHFKEINDTYGHQCGDEVLRAVAEAGNEKLRSFDLFGRYGGEEFAVLLPEVDPEGALAIAERLRRGIAAVEEDLGGIGVTASFGVASMLSTGSLAFDDLLRLADEALYRAKQRGRDRVELATCIPAPLEAVQ